jgi:prephenate dehydrogenase
MDVSERRPVIAIVGLGLVGRALGLALQRVKTNYEVWGNDREQALARAAAKSGAVDRTFAEATEVVEGADLVFITEPLDELRETLQVIAPHVREGALVTDTCSVKADVLHLAESVLPSGVSFIGGHPVVHAAPQGQETELLDGVYYALVPASGASRKSVDVLARIVAAIGARPYFIDAEEHDALVAGVRHLPYVLASVFARMVSSSPQLGDLHRLAGSEAAALLGVGEGDSGVSDEVVANRSNLVSWLDLAIRDLVALREDLASAEPELIEEALFEWDQARARWTDRNGEKSDEGDAVTRELEDINPLRDMMFGRGFRRGKR